MQSNFPQPAAACHWSKMSCKRSYTMRTFLSLAFQVALYSWDLCMYTALRNSFFFLTAKRCAVVCVYYNWLIHVAIVFSVGSLEITLCKHSRSTLSVNRTFHFSWSVPRKREDTESTDLMSYPVSKLLCGNVLEVESCSCLHASSQGFQKSRSHPS